MLGETTTSGKFKILVRKGVIIERGSLNPRTDVVHSLEAGPQHVSRSRLLVKEEDPEALWEIFPSLQIIGGADHCWFGIVSQATDMSFKGQ